MDNWTVDKVDEYGRNELAKATGPIDKAWEMEIPTFKPNDNPHGLLEESSFKLLFPEYREKYIKAAWPLVVKALESYHIKAELDLVEGTMEVKTTRKTWDPYIIIKARDLIRLLARCVPFEIACKVLEDNTSCDIIKISGLVNKKDKFLKRRQRLIGPDGCTLKSIELLTNCRILVHGKTVSVIGPIRSLSFVREIVLDTMHNIHPIYNIKSLMIKRELLRNPLLANENWDRFLPKFKKTLKKNTKPKKKLIKRKKETVFPPPPTERKIDVEIRTGEYFLSKKEKQLKKQQEIAEKQVNAVANYHEKREQAFIAPEEPVYQKKKVEMNTPVDINALKAKIQNARKKTKKANSS